jgi:hypothetical protein
MNGIEFGFGRLWTTDPETGEWISIADVDMPVIPPTWVTPPELAGPPPSEWAIQPLSNGDTYRFTVSFEAGPEPSCPTELDGEPCAYTVDHGGPCAALWEIEAMRMTPLTHGAGAIMGQVYL